MVLALVYTGHTGIFVLVLYVGKAVVVKAAQRREEEGEHGGAVGQGWQEDAQGNYPGPGLGR